MKKLAVALILVIFTFLLTPSASLASGSEVVRVCEDGVCYLTTETTGSTSTTISRDRVTGEDITPPRGFADNLGNYINSVLTAVILIAALLVFFYLIWGGIQWITSGGDKGKIEQARQKLVAAVVGIIILAASYAILNLVLYFLGFDSLDDVFRSLNPIGATTTTTRTATTSLTRSTSNSPSEGSIIEVLSDYSR